MGSLRDLPQPHLLAEHGVIQDASEREKIPHIRRGRSIHGLLSEAKKSLEDDRHLPHLC